VEIDGGSLLPQSAYSMIEVDALTCAFERPGGPSFEMLAADVVIYEKTGVLTSSARLPETTTPAERAAGDQGEGTI
jgi:hypothetical protein